MRIIIYECKKALTSPTLITLIFLFIAFNIFLINSNSYFKEELKVVNELAETYGVNMTDESLLKFEQDLQQDIAKLNEIIGKHNAQQFSSVYDFLNSLRHEDQNLYSEEDWDHFKRFQLREMYYNLAQSIDSEYEQIDWTSIGELEISKHRLKGNAAMTLTNEYAKFSQRFEEMKEIGEHKTWFYVGNPYRMHSFLFRTIFGHMIFESIILIVLGTALITNFEFENRTHLVSYPTKRGRRLMLDKLAASLLTSTIITAILLISTLGTYFTVFDYSHLWGSSISSALNWEYNLPYVSWWNLSFLSFLVWGIALVYVCLLLFSSITYAISIVVKNSYYTFFIFAAFFAIAYLMMGFMPKSSNLIYISGHNLSTLMMNPHLFFMGSSGLMMFKYYELMTVIAWIIIATGLCFYLFNKFNKQDIH